MKRFIVLLLVCMLIPCGLPAFAAGGYFEMMNQDFFYGEYLLDVGGTNVVTLTSEYAVGVHEYGFNQDVMFTIITIPENTQILSFDTDECTVFDADALLSYNYKQYSKESYETFIAEAASDDYILADGSDGYAIYLNPDKDEARAMIGTPELGKTAKLLVKITTYNKKDSPETRLKKLTDAVTAETDRLVSTLAFDTCEYWTIDAFKGFVHHSNDYNLTVAYNFPDINAGNSGKETREFIVECSYGKVKTNRDCSDGSRMSITINVDTYSYIDYIKEGNPEQVFSVILADGNTYDVYISSYEQGKKIDYDRVKIQRVLYDKAGYNNDKPLYLYIEFSGDYGFDYNEPNYWTDTDAMCRDLNVIVKGFSFQADFQMIGKNTSLNVAYDDSFVPVIKDPSPDTGDTALEEPEADVAAVEEAEADVAAVEEAAVEAPETDVPAAADPNEWECPNCGQINKSNFCGNCATPRPVQDTSWVCPGCGATNESKFCGNCGTPRTDSAVSAEGSASPLSYSVGDVVPFGSYGGETIEWMVLEVEDNIATLISVCGLDAMPYANDSSDVNWETCALRGWLNGEFLNSAFSAEERARLKTVTVTADGNPDFSTQPGNDTQDTVWLPSYEEANRLFASDESRICYATDYAKSKGVQTTETGECIWWLRTPGRESANAAISYIGGMLYSVGATAKSGGVAVRPMIALSLS